MSTDTSASRKACSTAISMLYPVQRTGASSAFYKSQVLTYEGMVYEWNTHVQQQHSVPSAYACLFAAVFRSSRSSSDSFLQDTTHLQSVQF